MERFSSLEQNVEVLSRQMVDLKQIKYQVATREGRDMDGWLENVEGRESEFDEMRKEFEILRRENYDDVIDLNALDTLSKKMIDILKAVKLLRDEGNASTESSPVHSNKMIHKTFAYEDLIKFTSNFTKNVGSGGFSNVYKGQLDDDKQVAVKVLKNTVAIKDFMAEMQTMVTASHPNLVRLYGFCFDYNMKALVYEFMKNGSLDKILFDNHLSLEWEEFYVIALGTAKGLAYLHDGCGQQIIHRDMKPANVLLDENISAKITDFGLAKFLSKDANYYTITRDRGTYGYIAPEFGYPTSQITNKCDVYSFGVTLFEVLGKRGNGEFGANWFPQKIWKEFEKGQLDELIKSFGIPETHKGKAKILSMVAFWCSQYTVQVRPSMSDVVDVLEKEIQVNTPPYPFEFQTSMDYSMLPSQEVIQEIHSEASPVIHERLGISIPTLVAAPDVFINAIEEEEMKDKAVKDSEEKQATTNFSEQFQHENKKLLSELGTARLKPFSLLDLERFTTNFSEKIGSGGYGIVYKGQFLDGMEVAIKVLHDMEVFDQTFSNFIMTLEMVNHPNIVKLHGYCFDGHMKALVYEYIGNGSLDKVLYRNHHFDIEWEQLYEIAIETAKALSFLHVAGFIHHDIKASNILLDGNLSPKIRCKGHNIMMKWGDDGTRMTFENDVYCFGMLLFEVLGRRNVNKRGPEWFPLQVWEKFDEGLLGKVREDCGINKKDNQKVFNLCKVALWCAQSNPRKRPSMSSVVNMLEMKIQVMDPPNPFPSHYNHICAYCYNPVLACRACNPIFPLKEEEGPRQLLKNSHGPTPSSKKKESPRLSLKKEDDPRPSFKKEEGPIPSLKKEEPKSTFLTPDVSPNIYWKASPSMEPRSVISNPSIVASLPQQFSHSDLIRFTSEFADIIGRDKLGVVYKGKFQDGVEVAIKVLHDIDEAFMDVVMSMGKVYHSNIVKLHGYCFDGHMKAIVYEYIEKGSLDIILYRDHLHLEWKQLYEIAIETAKRLSVLHAVGIIHHDIKASNILLNSNLSPKIRTEWRGLIILERNHDATKITGSYGYSAPEMWIPTSEVTFKSDVYSFGILLFEILGRRSISNHRGKEWFPAQVWMMFDKGLLGKVWEDCGINKEDSKKAYNLSKVALWCVQFDPQKRPSMSSVVKMLKMKIPVMDPPNPFPHAQLSSTSSSPELNRWFNSEASPSIELLSFHEKKAPVEKSQSGGNKDEASISMLNLYEKNCPLGGQKSVVLYTTVRWQDRITECNYVSSILKSHQVGFFERDISANLGYWVELRKLLDRTEVPALFVHGRFIGGVNEVKSLEEEGKLMTLLYEINFKKIWRRKFHSEASPSIEPKLNKCEHEHDSCPQNSCTIS